MIKIEERPYFQILRSLGTDIIGCDHKVVAQCFAQQLYEWAISPRGRKILQLSLGQGDCQDNIDKFLYECNIESLNQDDGLLLTYAMRANPNLHVRKCDIPRLNGLYAYRRFQNLELISHFHKIVKVLNNRGIVPLVIKGGAMKILRPELPRVMSDIDIVVRNEQERCISQKVVSNLGYTYSVNAHSTDVHLRDNDKKGVVDIHSYLLFDYSREKSIVPKLFSRAKMVTFNGCQCYVPSLEDLFFIIVNNLIRNLRGNTGISGIKFSLFDIAYIMRLSEDFNWEIVRDDARRCKVLGQTYLGMQFVYCADDKISLEELGDSEVFKAVRRLMVKERYEAMLCDLVYRIRR